MDAQKSNIYQLGTGAMWTSVAGYPHHAEDGA